MLLSVLGNVIGRGAHFRVEEDLHHLKIWPVLVGETAKGRKGTALNRIRRLMERVDPDWYEGCIATGLSSGEGVMERLRDPVVEEDEDGTVQIIDPGVTDKRLLIEEPEFGSPLTVMRREGNTLSMVSRNLWDDRTLQTMTRTKPLRASDTHATIIGNITRSELLRHLNEEKLGGGIGNRFVFVLVQRSKVLPHGGERDVFTDDQVHRLREAISFGKEEREISLSAEVEDPYGYSARELWEEVYADLSEGRRGLFGAVTSRAEAYVRRIATIYAVLDLSEDVKVAHLLAALAVWQYCEQSAYLIFRDRTGDRLADELLEALKDAGEEGMTHNDIHDFFGRNQKSVRIGSVLRDLERQGLVRMEKEKTDGPGRPPTGGSYAMRRRRPSHRISAYLRVPLYANLPPESRRHFVAPPGRKLIVADYKNIELVLAGVVAGDDRLLGAFCRGDDVHSLMAYGMLASDAKRGGRPVAEDEVKQFRPVAKLVAFSILCGSMAGGLAEGMTNKVGVSTSKAEAQALMRNFFETYPRLKRWYVEEQAKAKASNDRTRTLIGRLRLLDLEYRFGRWCVKPQLRLNTPIQGSAGDGLKYAAAFAWERRRECPGDSKLVNLVHDEVILEIDEEHAEVGKVWLERSMLEGMAELPGPAVPASVEISMAIRWKRS